MVRAMILEPGRDAEVRFICPKKIDVAHFIALAKEGDFSGERDR